LEYISQNLLITARCKNGETGELTGVAQVAQQYKQAGVNLVGFGDKKYGKGSSREHAPLEPRFLGGRAIMSSLLPEFTRPTSRSRECCL